jgi:hypothetical protein
MLVVAATSTNSSSARGKKTANTESKNQIGGETRSNRGGEGNGKNTEKNICAHQIRKREQIKAAGRTKVA